MDNLINILKEKETNMYLDDYNITIKNYIGYDELDNIIKTTLSFESFADREKNIDMWLLHYCAGIDVDILQSTDPDLFLYSGLINAVKSHITNLGNIYKGIEYEESIMKQILKISNNLPDIVKEALEKEKEQEKNIKKKG